jgi:hypothetical protein
MRQNAAAVWAARIHLECRLAEMCENASGSRVLGKRAAVHAMIPFLLSRNEVGKKTLRRANELYTKCSKVVHYGKVDRQYAIALVRDVEDVMMTLGHRIAANHLDDHPQPKRVVGFAENRDYEREMLIEQFGEGVVA